MARLNFYIRAILCLLWFLITTILALLVCLVRWRDHRNAYFMSHTFTVGAEKLLGYKIIIKNKERLRANQPCIFICNHQSNLDILVQANAFPQNTVCIGKREVIYIPLFGLLFYLSGNILLNRKHHKSAMARMGVAKQFILERKLSVYMFPEGTRNHGAAKLLPFKRGAFHLAVGTQVPLVPVVSSPIHETVDAKNRIIHKRDIVIEVLEPISTVGKHEDDVPALMAVAKERMQKSYDGLKAVVGKP